MMGTMGFGWGFIILPLAFLALIVLGAYYLVTEFIRRTESSSSQDREAIKILRKRYASGEITKEEYLKMKRDLEFASE